MSTNKKASLSRELLYSTLMIINTSMNTAHIRTWLSPLFELTNTSKGLPLVGESASQTPGPIYSALRKAVGGIMDRLFGPKLHFFGNFDLHPVCI